MRSKFAMNGSVRWRRDFVVIWISFGMLMRLQVKPFNCFAVRNIPSLKDAVLPRALSSRSLLMFRRYDALVLLEFNSMRMAII